jgi:hemerythrin superfamily protein
MLHHNHAKQARALLERDHARIETLLERAAASVREDCRADAEARWDELESALLSHFDAEELYVIPELSRVSPKEASDLVAEHARIRAELGKLGIAFELHCIRADMVDAFCATLREHAAHEEALMYPLVEEGLEHATLQRLLRRLEQPRNLRAQLHDAVVALSGAAHE